MDAQLLSPAQQQYYSLGPNTPTSALRRLRTYETVRALLWRAPLSWWLTRFFFGMQAAVLFTVHFFLYQKQTGLHKSGGCLLFGAAVVSGVLPFFVSLTTGCGMPARHLRNGLIHSPSSR